MHDRSPPRGKKMKTNVYSIVMVIAVLCRLSFIEGCLEIDASFSTPRVSSSWTQITHLRSTITSPQTTDVIPKPTKVSHQLQPTTLSSQSSIVIRQPANTSPTDASLPSTDTTPSLTDTSRSPSGTSTPATDASASPMQKSSSPTDTSTRPTNASPSTTEASTRPTNASPSPTEASTRPTNASPSPTDGSTPPTNESPQPTNVSLPSTNTSPSPQPTNASTPSTTIGYLCAKPPKKKPVKKGNCFKVNRGQLTFDAEGEREERGRAVRVHTRILRVPTNMSGLNIGRGYDMKDKDKD
ncbi:Hypothetical predicted protein [Paramuricea clavata]|uniref:Uncharacterized protein n=1 Tax=Paramuricea clavata TaxID=317549 RepID=A0A6S7GWP6_PARCT|nr:Hypothetical predicted protein [Paramuricea clavata]